MANALDYQPHAPKSPPLSILIGAAAGVTLALLFNAVPYVVTYDAPGTCGLRTAGYPFTVSSFGGFAPHTTWYPKAILGNALVAAIFGIAGGYVARLFFSRHKQSRLART